MSSARKFSGFSMDDTAARVMISWEGVTTPKLVLLPESVEELIQIGSRKFGQNFRKLVTKEGAEVDDIELIRDGDHLILITDQSTTTPKTPTPEKSFT